MRKIFTFFAILTALSCTEETEENSQILTAKIRSGRNMLK